MLWADLFLLTLSVSWLNERISRQIGNALHIEQGRGNDNVYTVYPFQQLLSFSS